MPAEVPGTALAAGGYQAARADLKADLSRAVEALSHAHETEQVADSAVKALLSGAQSDLQAERAARAADLSVLGAQSQLFALRAELDRARAEITQLRTALESERLARVAAEAALGAPVPPGDLTELASQQTEVTASAPRRSPEEADRLVAALEAAANSLRATVPSPTADDADGVRSERSAQRTFATAPPSPEPRAAEVAAPTQPVSSDEAALPDERPADTAVPSGLAAPADGAAGSTLAAPVHVDAPADLPARAEDPTTADDAAPVGLASPDTRVVDHRPMIVATVAARAAAEAARQALAPIVAPAPGLRRALLTLAREEPVTAGALIAGLLPAQGAILEEPLSYDLTVRGYGTFAVTVGHGGAEVQRLTKRRPRKEAAFHVAGEPLVLAQLLAGERKRLGRFRPSARVTGRRRRARAALGVIPASTLSLAEAVKAGARLEPALVYSALPYAVSPEWTRGHVFTVAQEIRELGPRAWYVTARDGVRLSVVEYAAGAAADATVTMSRAAFDRLLKGESPVPGDLPVIRGNREAVATLKRWTDLARNEPRA
ncbi:hypothetical protein OJ998_37645 [Solirubrobacter taibaiensis]|nr:hypothetical protein [Solirubrobacter taibaiensis]